MFGKILQIAIVAAIAALLIGQNGVRASEETAGKDEAAFIDILNGAYRVSCDDVSLLRKYYLEDAEIINNGRQVTLDETINELQDSISAVKNLQCSYQPKLRSMRIDKTLAYVVVRETISLSAPEFGDQKIEQLCTYIFLKKDKIWMIAHDHCSSVPGMAV